MQLGRELKGLTRKPGLRSLLKVMRRTASAAGLGSLQTFLEAGFDAFAGMQGPEEFAGLVERRETDWISRVFDNDAVAWET